MTFLNLQEEVLNLFPKMGLTRIKNDINVAYKKFASETGVLKDSTDLTIDYDAVSYAIPSNVDSIESIRYLNSAGTVLSGSSSLTYNIEADQIVFMNYRYQQITVIPASIATITLYHTAIPDTLVNDSDSTAWHTQFDNAIIEDILRKYYMKVPKIPMSGADGQVRMIVDKGAANIHDAEYKRLRINGLRYAGHNRHNSGGSARYYRT